MMDFESSQSGFALPATMMRESIDIAQSDWLSHPVLKRAVINDAGDALEWPEVTNEQRAAVADIALSNYEGEIFARLHSEINFDLFVETGDEDDAQAHPPFQEPDKQRYYTRFTGGGFHLVGGFSAVTGDGHRHYFQWLAGGWTGISLHDFLSVRDDPETQFAEVSPASFTYLFPDSLDRSSRLRQGGERQASRHRYVDSENLEDRGSEVSAAEDQSPTLQESSGSGGDADGAAHEVPESVHRDADPVRQSIALNLSQSEVQRSISMALATVALRGCTDRMGAPLIDHAARVSEKFDAVSDTVRHCASWLHDALECSDFSETDLCEAGLLAEIAAVVRVLTHDPELSEEEWLRAISSDPDARAVKLAAIEDNASPWRLRHLEEETQYEILNTLGRWRERLGVDTPG